jgi:hypothetical protein
LESSAESLARLSRPVAKSCSRTAIGLTVAVFSTVSAGAAAGVAAGAGVSGAAAALGEDFLVAFAAVVLVSVFVEREGISYWIYYCIGLLFKLFNAPIYFSTNYPNKINNLP